MLRPMPIEPVPPETVRVAHATFPKGKRYLRLADELETLFTDDTFQALFPTHGQPAQPPWQLALVTILPFAEGLSDRQAAHKVQGDSLPYQGRRFRFWASRQPEGTPKTGSFSQDARGHWYLSISISSVRWTTPACRSARLRLVSIWG
jgi:hypothetical protein